MKKHKLARELSDLVNYCVSTRFEDFQMSAQSRKYIERDCFSAHFQLWKKREFSAFLHINMQQTSFENNLAKGEIVMMSNFTFLDKSFQLHSIVILLLINLLINLLIKSFHSFALIFSMWSAADILYVGKGVQSVSVCLFFAFSSNWNCFYYLTITLFSAVVFILHWKCLNVTFVFIYFQQICHKR